MKYLKKILLPASCILGCSTFAVKSLPIEDAQKIRALIKNESALSNHIQAVNNMVQETNFENQVVKQLAAVLGYYGGNSSEQMDPEYAKELLKDFMYILVPELTSNQRIYNGFHFNISTEQYSLTEVREKIKNQLFGNQFSPKAKDWLADLYFSDKDPTLNLKLNQEVIYGSHTWYVLHHASLIAESLQIDPKTLNIQELTEIYKLHVDIIDDEVISDISAQSILSYALINRGVSFNNYSRLSERQQTSLTQRAINFVKRESQKAQQAKSFIQQKVATLKQPVPTRKSVAEKIVRQTYGSRTTCKFTQRRPIVEAYLDGDAFCLGALHSPHKHARNNKYLPSLDKEFTKTFNQHKTSKIQTYVDLSKKLAGNFPRQFKNILRSRQRIIIPTLSYSPGRYTYQETRNVGCGAGGCGQIQVPKTAQRQSWQPINNSGSLGGLIIAVNLNGKNRYIAATWNHELMFQFLPSNINNPQTLSDWLFTHRRTFFPEKVNEIKKYNSNNRNSVTSIQVNNPSSQSVESKLRRQIGLFAEHYKQEAYGQTAYQRTVDLVLDILVPFHGMATADNRDDAIIAGITDALIFIPATRAAVKVAGSAAKVGSRLAMASTKVAFIQAAQQNGIAGVTASFHAIAKNAHLYKNSAQLSQAIFSSLNPLSGLGNLTKSAGKASYKSMNAAYRSASSGLKSKFQQASVSQQSLNAFSKQGDTYVLRDMNRLQTTSSGYNKYNAYRGADLDLVNIQNRLIPAKSLDNWNTFSFVNPHTKKAFGKIHSTSAFQQAALKRSKITNNQILDDLTETQTSGLYQDSLNNYFVEINSDYYRVSKNPNTNEYFLASHSRDTSYKWKVEQQYNNWRVADDYIGLRGGAPSKLKRHEVNGGHLLKEHVDPTPQNVLTRITYRKNNITRVGVFTDTAAAESVVSAIIPNNTAAIQRWMRGNQPTLELTTTMPSNIGTVYSMDPRKGYAGTKSVSDLNIAPSRRAKIVLKKYNLTLEQAQLKKPPIPVDVHNRLSRYGYQIFSGYPIP